MPGRSIAAGPSPPASRCTSPSPSIRASSPRPCGVSRVRVRRIGPERRWRGEPPPRAAVTGGAIAWGRLSRCAGRRAPRRPGGRAGRDRRRESLLLVLDRARQARDAVPHLDVDAGVLQVLTILDALLNLILQILVARLHLLLGRLRYHL